MEESLKEIYYNAGDTGSYGGVDRLYRRAVEKQVPHISRDAVRDCLSRQRAYTLHKPARRTFPETVSMSAKSISNGRPIWPIWLVYSETMTVIAIS